MGINIRPHTSSLHLPVYSGNNTYHISNMRLKRLLSNDKEEALYMGLWDRFCEFFREDKKAPVIEALYDFLHNSKFYNDKSLSYTPTEEVRYCPSAVTDYNNRCLMFERLRELTISGKEHCLQRKVTFSDNVMYTQFRINGLCIGSNKICEIPRTGKNGLDLRGFNFSWADLSGNVLKSVNLQNVNLSHSILINTVLDDADLSNTCLDYANMRSTEMPGVNLSGARLFRAKIINAQLILANLNNAILELAEIRDTNFYNADFSDIQLFAASLSRGNCFEGVKFRDMGLEIFSDRCLKTDGGSRCLSDYDKACYLTNPQIKLMNPTTIFRNKNKLRSV